ncbi:hypothetical protein G3I76_05215 [Streptomyces sp. SID11233]|nr:hypothetical protein [Streptomyces sp. SID11233]
MSEDGTTYVDPSGSVEHGITSPDGYFLPNGEIRTIDGRQVYGRHLTDGSFISQNNTIIVLAGGAVVRGTYDGSTGIFTGQNGNGYFVGEDGVKSGHFRKDDGALELADGSAVMTPASWKVNLEQLAGTIALLENGAPHIKYCSDLITTHHRTIEGSWASPAGGDFALVAEKVDSAMTTLNTLLDDTIMRMKVSYDNYVTNEAANFKNLGQ